MTEGWCCSVQQPEQEGNRQRVGHLVGGEVIAAVRDEDGGFRCDAGRQHMGIVGIGRPEKRG